MVYAQAVYAPQHQKINKNGMNISPVGSETDIEVTNLGIIIRSSYLLNSLLFGLFIQSVLCSESLRSKEDLHPP